MYTHVYCRVSHFDNFSFLFGFALPITKKEMKLVIQKKSNNTEYVKTMKFKKKDFKIDEKMMFLFSSSPYVQKKL